MTYKKKVTVLLGVIAVLALTWVLSLIFAPERRGARSDAYSWLDPSQNERITRVAITQAPDGESELEPITLTRNEGRWFVSHNGKDYPARNERVNDFIAALSKRAPYPVRSSSASSHERLSLTENRAVHVAVAAGVGMPALSLLIGQEDLTGQVFLRMQGHNEVRSGENIFSSYTRSSLQSWYNLRLFPETEHGGLDASAIQRLTVYPPANDPADGDEAPPLAVSPLIFSRRGNEWTFNFNLANPNMEKVNSYIRDILNTVGNDFVHTIAASDPMFNDSRFILEFGNGDRRTIRLAPPDEEGRRYASVSGSDWVYSIPAWAANRLFIETSGFELD